MRLICPNCDAQYEVPQDVIPPEGRDVQCSNCGQTWYQEHPDHVDEASRSGDDALEDEEYAASGLQEDDSADHPDTGPRYETEDDQAPFWDNRDDLHTAPETTSEAVGEDDAGPKRRELDPSIAEVLRAEAEREAQARRAESLSGMESQPELGLPESRDDVVRRSQEARERMARLRGQSAPDDDDAEEELLPSNAPAMGSRRDLLPDIEEINSTLRSNSDRSPTSDPGQTAQIEMQEKRSSRLGFSLTVALFAVLVLIYVFAQQISGAVPQLAGAVDGYVSLIDGWRGWLDGHLQSMLSWLDQAAVSSGQ